jgi:uncharacterized protein YecE (DUF72 family)
MGKILIGISGWRYSGWRGDFYLLDMTQRRELEFASRALLTTEINSSFYSLQRPTMPAGYRISHRPRSILAMSIVTSTTTSK